MEGVSIANINLSKIFVIGFIILTVAVMAYITKLKFNISTYEKKILSLQNEIIISKHELTKQNSKIEKFKTDTVNSKRKLETEIKNIRKKYQAKIKLTDVTGCENKLDIIDKTFKEWAVKNENI